MATSASGKVKRNTDPHQKCSSRMPAQRGPSAAIAPPTPDQRAIAFVRPGPGVQSAVISASVVGYAIPAASPPPTRAMNNTVSDGAYAASNDIGIANDVPRMSNSFRPYRSPSAPNQRTEHARPSEYPTAIRSSVVWLESKCFPIDGNATFATERFRFATAAPRINAANTRPGLAGATAGDVAAFGRV